MLLGGQTHKLIFFPISNCVQVVTKLQQMQ